MTEDITLPSGAKLKITLSPFAVSKALYQACLEELKSLKLDPNAEVDLNLFKDLFCAGFSSKRIEQCLDECMKRVHYNDRKITPETFEPAEAREDYLQVCLEVALTNIRPFMKNLGQLSGRISEQVSQNLQQKS